MKSFIPIRWMWLALLMILLCSAPVRAQDMRELQIRARQARQALLQKAVAEEQTARQEAERSKARIAGDRAGLEQAVKELEVRVRELTGEVRSLEEEDKILEEKEARLAQTLAATDGMVRELVGVIRGNAKDIAALIERSLQTALADPQTGFLHAIAGQAHFPGMEDIDRMVNLLWGYIRNSGEVRITRGRIVDRSGGRTEADILVLGHFSAAYRCAGEVGFLNYSPAGRNLFALSRLPSGGMQKYLRRYMQGQSEAVPMDITRGGALSQLTHELSLRQQVLKGGPIVWPILAILAVGLALVFERIVFLLRKQMDADGLTRRMASMAAEQDWAACQKACAQHAGKPVARVMAAGLDCCLMPREAMENALQEAILREVPPMERFLSTLGMLAAIAPLLGLLGTVTGMIDTFHVITRSGTGDPRMMSGGISEALVTTMLGLSVAIPIMLAHTLLNRAVDKRIGQMEEKALALINIIHKSRDALRN